MTMTDSNMKSFISQDSSRRSFMERITQSCLGVTVAGFGSSSLTASNEVNTASENVPKGKAKQVIYLYMSGGMSHLDTLDPKTDPKVMGPVQSIPTNVDGIRLSEYLPNLAKCMDEVALIRSMYSNQGAHEQGTYFMRTSYTMRGTIRHPGMGAWLLHHSGKINLHLPGSVRIGGGSRMSGAGGFLGPDLAPLHIGDPKKGIPHQKRFHNVSEKEFQKELELSKWMNANFQRRFNMASTTAHSEMFDEAVHLMKSKDMEAFDLTRESTVTREAYGPSKFGQGCLLARRLIEKGVRFAEVTMGGWDTHTDNFSRVQDNATILDQALSTLLLDLRQRGLLDETLVVLTTEFGRSPEIVSGDGRNHHPQAFSSLLAGAGVKGGQVYGSSDDHGQEVQENMVKIPDFNATIAQACGSPIDQIVKSASGRPFRIADKGKPISDILA
jgi:uncharacterized protein (DUF1501 family)